MRPPSREAIGMMDRRQFLGTLGAAIAAGGRLGAKSLANIGLQLYTVRTDLEKDFDGTLARVAATGYTEVEFAGYFNHSPQQVKAALAAHGLVSPSAHIDYATLTTKLPDTIEAAHVLGQQFIVNPWIDESMRKSLDDWKRIADSFNRIGRQLKEAGLQFAYHNHNFEFAPLSGTEPYDLLLQTCDPALVRMEMDLCWTTVAGKNPLDYFRRYPGRFPMVHVKGLSKRPPAAPVPAPIPDVLPTITDVGTHDLIDWPRIFQGASEAGISHYFVEHDVPASPFASIKASYGYLRQLQF
jgi:sugar phosphate isomerase/epimerase